MPFYSYGTPHNKHAAPPFDKKRRKSSNISSITYDNRNNFIKFVR